MLKKLITLVAVAFFLYLGYSFVRKFSKYGSEDFDREIWKSSVVASRDECIRGGMADDVKDNFIKKGMGREKVVDVLGPADRERFEFMEYQLGMCNMVDPSSMEIYFGADGRVSAVKIIEH